ncbi:hypothetical protein RhiirA4_475262 [Rhizophagus irregularis]|uniref:Uncharacterized protein n=1 Tax=Rhizophagus irregularis TaxID=588596 RepID=A0A2I1H9U8_9GLOM|nr:hypothetical protein RhiirA4_475262 [Rhizophagus irregularis]
MDLEYCQNIVRNFLYFIQILFLDLEVNLNVKKCKKKLFIINNNEDNDLVDAFNNNLNLDDSEYGVIYKATWLRNNETAILKRFEIPKILVNESSEGDLQNNFTKINWNEKLFILRQISKRTKQHTNYISNNEIYGVIPRLCGIL